MNNSSGWNFPDFSGLQAFLSGLRELVRPINEVMQNLREIVKPFTEFVEDLKPKLIASSQVLLGIGRKIKAIERLGEAQFVYWDYMNQDFVDDIVDAKNINSFLRQCMIKDKYKKVDEIINKTLSSNQIEPFRRLYTQAVDAFREKKNDLAVVGFTAVFDGLLSVVSNDQTHRLNTRIAVIKEKLNKDAVLDNDEYAMITLIMTLEKTLDTFVAFYDFKNEEPKGLNRHWIAHGRTLRRKTQLDCVKMNNLLYGLILVSNLEQSKT